MEYNSFDVKMMQNRQRVAEFNKRDWTLASAPSLRYPSQFQETASREPRIRRVVQLTTALLRRRPASAAS